VASVQVYWVGADYIWRQSDSLAWVPGARKAENQGGRPTAGGGRLEEALPPGGLGEGCKLPQRGLEQRPGRIHICGHRRTQKTAKTLGGAKRYSVPGIFIGVPPPARGIDATVCLSVCLSGASVYVFMSGH